MGDAARSPRVRGVRTGEIEDMMELSVKRLLLRCGEVFWELQLGSLELRKQLTAAAGDLI